VAHVEKRRQRYGNGTLGPTTYRVRYRDPSGRERSKTFRKATDAERFKKVVDADLVRGEWHDPKPGRKLFSEWVREYTAEVSKRPTTAARDAVVLKTHFLPALADFPLSSITPRDIQKIVTKMQANLRPATVRTNYAVVAAVFSAAVQAELIPRSPCRGVRGIKTPNETRKRRRGLTAEEVMRLAAHVPTEYRAMIYMGTLGLRFSEVAGLKVSGIDFLGQRLTVRETVAEVEGKLQPADVKTGASERSLVVPPFVIAILSEHLARTNRKRPDEYVFQAPQGGPVRYTNFRIRVWKPAVEAAGLTDATFHSLRHSAGLLRQAGVHTQLIQQRLVNRPILPQTGAGEDRRSTRYFCLRTWRRRVRSSSSCRRTLAATASSPWRRRSSSTTTPLKECASRSLCRCSSTTARSSGRR